MSKLTTKERLKQTIKVVSKRTGKIVIVPKPIIFEITKVKLYDSIKETKKSLKDSISHYKDFRLKEKNNFKENGTHSTVMLNHFNERLECLPSKNLIELEVEKYNELIESGANISIQRMRYSRLMNVDIDGFIFGVDKLKLV